MIGTAVSHFDPQLYTNPEQYDIDRCLPKSSEQRKPGAFAPFGLGAHTCAGAGLAEVEISITLATLLRYTRLELDPPAYELKITYNPAPAPDKLFRVKVMELW